MIMIVNMENVKNTMKTINIVSVIEVGGEHIVMLKYLVWTKVIIVNMEIVKTESVYVILLIQENFVT
tara:strand:+ start:4067 stop:4267 length:201 start_codon:yes stop_codon:yes gene_type:complete